MKLNRNNYCNVRSVDRGESTNIRAFSQRFGYYLLWTCLLFSCCIISCKKFVQVPLPVTQLVAQSVYSSNSTAAAALTGIYQTMLNNSVGGGTNGISALAGLSADEFTLFPGAALLQGEVYTNAQLSTNPPPIWTDLYNLIYQANSAIAGISSSTGMTLAMKQQLTGEAEFIRAFCYFYLVNLYGNVPLPLTPNYQTNTTLARSPKAIVYQQIITDLTSAQKLLGNNYLTPSGGTTSERVRPNLGAATALLARVYLYEGNYQSADTAATTVINSGAYQLVGNLDNAFLAGNSEAIWQLESIDNGLNTPDGATFLLNDFGGPSTNFPYILSDSLEHAFEPGDLRATHWTDSISVGNAVYYFPYKYKLYYTGQPPTEYPTILRLAEQYLIRAEAEAHGVGGGVNAAIADLNVIRNRAGLPNYSGVANPTSVINAILHERRVELFTEYGHRWLDLKRTGTVDAVMTTVTPKKGGTWKPTDSLYVIPQADILSDSKLVQNPGYN